jgi:hypothetical protein
MKSSVPFAGLLALSMCQACLAQEDGKAAFSFDIPAKALGQALQDYAAKTRRPTLYRSEIVAHRISAPVQGRYTAKHALEKMLAGTGLRIEPFQTDGTSGFILEPMPDVPAYDVPAEYADWLQRRIWISLCGSRAAAPGNYRVLLRFRIDGAGRLVQPSLLTSSGQGERDDAIRATLQNVQLNILPPSTMPQPITILIVPLDAQANRRCDGAQEDAP